MNEVVVAQQAIEQVLGKLHVKTVVCVDDVYGMGDIDGTAELAIGWFHEALLREKSDECNELVKIPGFFNVPDEVWTRRLRTQWQELSREERITILDEISKLLDIELDIERDEKSASLLKAGLWQILE